MRTKMQKSVIALTLNMSCGIMALMVEDMMNHQRYSTTDMRYCQYVVSEKIMEVVKV